MAGKSRRDYFRQYREDYRTTLQLQRRPQTPFVGIDGEGGDNPNGRHEYYMLRAGDRFIEIGPDEEYLSTAKCLEFISTLDPNLTYVGFFFNYDVTKILRDIGMEKLRRLVKSGSRKRKGGYYPVDYREWQFDYIPGKEFKVRKRTGVTFDAKSMAAVPTYGPWVVVNDVGPFFQCKFVEALDTWKVGNDEERAVVASGKEERELFSLQGYRDNRERILRYNDIECKLVAELMEKFRDVCIMAGYVPSRWQGPGQLAEAAFRKHKIPKTRDIPLFQNDAYQELWTFGQHAFYGGRPELSAIGPVNRTVFQYDINSAYPHALLHLPCLEHGSWTRQEGGEIPVADVERRDNYALVFGSFDGRPREKPLWYGLAVRSKEGRISYPRAGRGWYWNFEIEGAKHQSFKAEVIWRYTRRCNCKTWEFVRDIYRERQEVGKDGIGIVYKLMLNSFYGKMVQSVGSAAYANPIYGSFITAWPRRKIQDFLHTSEACERQRCGTDVLMIATDSLASIRKRDDIPIDLDIGHWSEEVHPHGMFLIQPGFYLGTSGKRIKTRGVPRNAVEDLKREFESAFDRMIAGRDINLGIVRVPQKLLGGPSYCVHRNRYDLLGQWVEFRENDAEISGKNISFDWSHKRLKWPIRPPVPGVHSYVITYPPVGDARLTTTPYSKAIGGLSERAALRSGLEALPEHVPTINVGEW